MSQTPKRSTKGTLQLKEISIIPITNNLQVSSCVNDIASNSTQLKPQMSEDDVDLLRKKRCNDRCDSSESSDSGVITMSADSQATSDSSDPGSPFSHSSSTHTEEMTSQSKLPKAQKRQSNLIEKNDNKKRVRKDFCTNKNNLEIKLVPIAPSTESSAQQRKVTNASAANLISEKAYNFLANKPHLITFNSVQTPSLTPNLNKMTDYYKLKKDLSEKVTNGQQTVKTMTNPPVNNSSQLKVVSVGTSIASVTPMESPRPIDALKKTMTYEKKTAKIAPIIPVARKSAVCNIKPTKKPVSIAPRLEPKCSNVNKKPENELNKSEQTPTKQIQQMNNPQGSGQTVLLAAIRIPQQQSHVNSSQPPPLGLIQKTTTTTTTTKLGPFVQLHAQHMIPNIIHVPNLVANNKAAAQNLAKHQQQTSQNIYGSNSHEPHMLIKLQSQASASSNASPQKPQHHQQNSFAAQLASHQIQQLFMTSPVLFNAASLPAVLAQQLQHNPFGQIATSIASSAIPALQPIQTPLISSYASSSMTTQTSQSLHLPSLNAIIQSQNSAQQFQSLHQLPQQQCFQTLLKSSSLSMPPSLALNQAFVQQRLNATNQLHQQQQQQLQQQQQNIMTKLSPSKSVPPLAPASNFPIQITKNIPKMISVKSSSSQTSPKTKSPPPLLINQKVSLPKSSPVAAQLTNLKQEICVVPPLPSPAKITFDVEKEEKIFEESVKDIKSAISVLVEEKISADSAKSPILSQPKTIRFPPVNGKVTVWKKCVKISQKGVCNWEKCSKQFDSNSDLLDHLQDHINSQQGPFVCSWRDCKVNGREGSRGWLERHIISHVGSTKPFKCIVERCGMRFGSQVQLQKHVNGHFNGSDQLAERKRSSDPLILKKVKKDLKKFKVGRRQPWSARRFDFFDTGMVEVLKYRLEKSEMLYRGKDMDVSFKGKVIGKRRSACGIDEFKITWKPENIFDDEWIRKPDNPSQLSLQKKVSMKSMTLSQRCAISSYLENSNKSNSNECLQKLPRKYKLKAST